jgi:hypothetical protein
MLSGMAMRLGRLRPLNQRLSLTSPCAASCCEGDDTSSVRTGRSGVSTGQLGVSTGQLYEQRRARTATRPITSPPEASSYTEIRIKGRVSAALVTSLGQLGTELLPTETVLGGDLDSAALFGLVNRIGELGLDLIEVRRFPRRMIPVQLQISSDACV